MDIFIKIKFLLRFAFILIIVTMNGCATNDSKVIGVVEDAPVASSNSTKPLTTAPLTTEPLTKKREVIQSPWLVGQTGAKKAPPLALIERVERFDVSTVNVNAKRFFMGLVKDSDINIVVHPDVKGAISMRLKQVTLEETLDAVCDVYEFDYVKESYGYKILPRSVRTRLFKVDYLNVSREGTSSTQVSNGQISSGDSAQSGNNDSSAPGSSGEGNQASSSITNSHVETLSRTNFWESIEQSVTAIVGTGLGKRVVVSPQVGIVLVEAYTSELRAVEAFLQRAENALLRQVTIEAKILEVVLNEKFQAGIQWDTFEQGFGGQLGLNDGRVGAGFQAGDVSKLAELALGGIFSVGLNFTDFSSIIEVLESQGDVQVLSSPRISTVNNQKAVIKVGSEEYFVTNISNDTNQGTTGSTTTTDVTISPFFSGIALDVTPNISDKNAITLHIHPTITTVTDKIKEVGLADTPLILPLAYKTVRESDSIVKARSGQVIVLGGLIQNQVDARRADVPWLHKIPVVGLLFSQRRETMVKSELVILLRPVVVGEHSNRNQESKDFPLLNERFSKQSKSTHNALFEGGQ